MSFHGLSESQLELRKIGLVDGYLKIGVTRHSSTFNMDSPP